MRSAAHTPEAENIADTYLLLDSVIGQMKTITWKLHLKSDPKAVYDLLSTSEGRKIFSEQASEESGVIHCMFPNGRSYDNQILKNIPDKAVHLGYFQRKSLQLIIH